MPYFLLLIYFIVFGNLAHQYEESNIVIKHPIIKLNSSNVQVAAGYLIIENNSSETVSLIDINSNIAEKQEIHEVKLENDIYKMRPVKSGVQIKPGGFVEFKPGAYHFMFFKLRDPPSSGKMLNANLIFKNNLKIKIKFKVVIGNEHHVH